MKKIISIILCLLMTICLMTSCGTPTTNDNKKLSIVTTIFPEYDWVSEILGDNSKNTDLTILLDNGVDLHSYQPTADDIIKISTCDMFIYIGGESDSWVNDALKETTNNDMVVIDLLDVLGENIKEEEVKEGMQSEEEEHSDEVEYDEHIWLSLKNAEILCNYISDKLCKIDSENEKTYTSNTKAYIEKINALDKKYKEAVENSPHKTVLFGDRFPFRYLVDDYNINYYAAFVGCSAETEASFETISFLSKKIDELNLPCVLTIENSDKKIAETIISNTKDKNQEILTMDSMQSTTSKDIEKGSNYILIMEKNLEVLKEALK